MGAINYGTSEYITIGYNCNTEYARNDFGTDEEEQRQFEINFLYDEVKKELNDFSFYYFHVSIKCGYYDGFYIDIENNFPYAFDGWQDKRDAQKEITQIKQFLLSCVDIGLVACSPGWCTAYSSAVESANKIKSAVSDMRADVSGTPTFLQYERAHAV